jgi:hypothetical protein
LELELKSGLLQKADLGVEFEVLVLQISRLIFERSWWNRSPRLVSWRWPVAVNNGSLDMRSLPDPMDTIRVNVLLVVILWLMRKKKSFGRRKGKKPGGRTAQGRQLH